MEQNFSKLIPYIMSADNASQHLDEWGNEHKILYITGPSSSGKSTLAKDG